MNYLWMKLLSKSIGKMRLLRAMLLKNLHQNRRNQMSEDMNAKLQRNRDAIDAIDQQVVQLLNQRVRQDGGLDEEQVLAKVAAFNRGPLTDATLQAIYRAMMLAGLAADAVATAAYKVDALDL